MKKPVMKELEQVEWFAARLKELRQARGLTQEELAKKAEMSFGGVRDLEQGVNKPSWHAVLLLAEGLGVGCDAFLIAPAEQKKAEPGRPSKPKVEPAAKRPRGRPKKESSR